MKYTKTGQLGLASSTVASMGGIGMPGMNMPSKGSMNMKMSGGKGMSGMNTVSEPIGTSRSPVTIKNLTAYHTAESLAAVAQQVFDKNLKPVAQTNATKSISNLANYLSQLKDAINDKSSFMNVMELIHVKLHPTLISTYDHGLSMRGLE